MKKKQYKKYIFLVMKAFFGHKKNFVNNLYLFLMNFFKMIPFIIFFYILLLDEKMIQKMLNVSIESIETFQ